MAYFSNGTEGMKFDEQCDKCKYGDKDCSIALVQALYNYKAVGNELATEILNTLVYPNGTCSMYEAFEYDFKRNKND
jgi:hypothetical protein